MLVSNLSNDDAAGQIYYFILRLAIRSSTNTNDAYNEEVPVAFYKNNGFDFMFSTEEQEKNYRGIVSDDPLKTRVMYFDLILIKY